MPPPARIPPVRREPALTLFVSTKKARPPLRPARSGADAPPGPAGRHRGLSPHGRVCGRGFWQDDPALGLGCDPPWSQRLGRAPQPRPCRWPACVRRARRCSSPISPAPTSTGREYQNAPIAHCVMRRRPDSTACVPLRKIRHGANSGSNCDLPTPSFAPDKLIDTHRAIG